MSEFFFSIERHHQRRVAAAGGSNIPLPVREKKGPQVCMVDFTRDDRYVIVAASDRIVRIYNPSNGELLQNLEAHKNEVYAMDTCVANPRLLVTLGHDGLMNWWDIETGRLLKQYMNHVKMKN